MALWVRVPSPWWMVVLAAGAVASGLRPRGRAWGAAVVLLLVSVVVGLDTHRELARLGPGWNRIWSAQEARLADELTDQLNALLEAGEDAADRAAAHVDSLGSEDAQEALTAIRIRSGLAALAVYDDQGRPVVWSGEHRGPVPEEARTGTAPYLYGELPLFSYLYITAPIPSTGGTALAAGLLRADLPPALDADLDDFASRFRSRTGEEIRIFQPERETGEAIWDLVWEDQRLFSVAIVEPSRTTRRSEALVRRSRWMVGLAVIAWVLLAVGGRHIRGQAVFAGSILLWFAALLPLGSLLGLPHLFAPADFLLPGPVPLTLGRTLALAGAGTVLLALSRGGWPRLSPLIGATLPVAVGFPLVVVLLRSGVSVEFLEGSEASWITYEAAFSVLLTLVVYAAVRISRSADRRPAPLWTGWGAAGGALLLTALGGMAVRYGGELPAPFMALWAFPVALAARALSGPSRAAAPALRWVVAVALGSAAALPVAWADRTQARMAVAEVRLDRLGSRVDPYLDFLLDRLAAVTDSLDRSGAAPVEVLYEGWVQSGLAREGYPMWLTLWSPGDLPHEEFQIGVRNPRPSVADDFLDEVRRTGEPLVRRFDLADAHYLAVIPLVEGRVVTAAVPPLRELAASASLGPLFMGSSSREDPLTLVPLLPGDRIPPGPDTLRWERTDEGWEGETLIPYPDALYRAHYHVLLSGALVVVARATLLLVLDVVLLVAVWGLVGLVLGGLQPPLRRWLPVMSSFRARVTLALFGFFLLSNAIFGTLAYRTLSGAATRTAQVLAQRVAEDAAGWYFEVQGAMDLLARRVGADLLEYRDGGLVGGSVDELVRLGLYEGWLPWEVHRELSTGEDLRALSTSSLGRWEYALAFRRVPDGDVLAAPVPLEAGATAVRRREVADLLGFAVVMGAALSLVLALAVGRTLTRPIRTLQIASERVGSGNLRVQLPDERPDEFGSVFSAFNRMVQRLRRARRDLVRTTRRTQAIVEEAATGVVALDPGARVTLVNPRAEELLGERVEVGRPLSAEAGHARELVHWVELYFRDGIREAGTELQFGQRRIRVRARRISRAGPLGGAVLSLEDVTDELRTERILAWGEMAQQVAHEVKNPLTPIKLSVQHIRRAWEDRRSDFGEILGRNVESVLREIDRLAAIAGSFSRFGAPRAAGELPLEAVALHRVVDEILNLYVGGEGALRFEWEVPAELPPVRAREAEVKEVLVNLLENARAAVVQEGTIRVDACAQGGLVVLRVTDDGTGIPAEMLPRIFEPHFSTRSTGTGLGLAIVRRLVESWDGSVTVESREGEGTAVRVELLPWSAASGPEGPGGAGRA